MIHETAEKDIVNIAAKTLTGDIRDFLLDRLKNFQKPWVSMGEAEQRESINQTKEAAEHLVKKACRIISSEGRKVIEATVEQVIVKDGIKATMKCTNTFDALHELGGATGQIVLIVTSGAQDFVGEQAPALPIPDQADLLDSAQALKEDNVTPLK